MHFHWKFNIGNYEKLFRMKWLLFILFERMSDRENLRKVRIVLYLI
nr:MAG TPA: hypothetical protein [Caudoviricetes sp.]